MIRPAGLRYRSRHQQVKRFDARRALLESPPVAKLCRKRDMRRFRLPARCLVGRAATCSIVLEDPYASGEHARLLWMGGHWELRDLGSRNGTFLDGRRLEPGRPYTVGPGAELGFGGSEQGWHLEDASPPGAAATDLATNDLVEGDAEILVLPNDGHVAASIYPGSSGGWLLETEDGSVEPVSSQQTVQVQGRAYRLELPVIADQTPMVDLALTLDNIAVRFEVSQDEETVVLVVVLHGQETRLEAREHHYLLLLLARARAQDPEGWIRMPDLCRMLRADENAVNVAIHRARQQLGQAGVEGAAGIVQTSRGRRRFGLERFEITSMPS